MYLAFIFRNDNVDIDFRVGCEREQKKVKVLLQRIKSSSTWLFRFDANLSFLSILLEMLTSMRHHTKLLFISITFCALMGFSLAQRVAPGVNPAQYVSKIHDFFPHFVFIEHCFHKIII